MISPFRGQVDSRVVLLPAQIVHDRNDRGNTQSEAGSLTIGRAAPPRKPPRTEDDEHSQGNQRRVVKPAPGPGDGEAGKAQQVDISGQLRSDRLPGRLAADRLEGVVEPPREEDQRHEDRRAEADSGGGQRLPSPEQTASGNRRPPIHQQLRGMKLVIALAVSNDHDASCRPAGVDRPD